MQACDMPSRREFFKLAGVAGSALAVGSVFGRPGFAAEEGPQAEKKKAPFSLGLASYTLRKFDLDQTLAMTQRVGLTHICLKSFHLPLDATAEQIAAAVAKVKEAGLDLYGVRRDFDEDRQGREPGVRLCQGGRHADDRRRADRRTCCPW